MLYLVSLLNACAVRFEIRNLCWVIARTLDLIRLPFELTSEVSTSFILACLGLLGPSLPHLQQRGSWAQRTRNFFLL